MINNHSTIRLTTASHQNPTPHHARQRLGVRLSSAALALFLLTLCIALFERDYAEPLGFQFEYARKLQHWSLPYPDITT